MQRQLKHQMITTFLTMSIFFLALSGDVLYAEQKNSIPAMAARTEQIPVSSSFMPNLKGVAKDKALKMLNELGLRNISIKSKYSEYEVKDTVLEQNYPANAPVRSNFKYILTISNGPDPEYHNRVMELCQRKGWTGDLQPYIASSIKFLLKNTVLSADEVLKRLDQNVERIYLAGADDGIGDRAGIYNTTDIVLNRYFNYFEKALIHEMVHALSYHKADYKLGFDNDTFDTGDSNCSNLSEGFTDIIASRSLKLNYRGYPVITDSENSGIVVYEHASQAYSREAAIIQSLNYLIENQGLEKIFFMKNAEYLNEVNAFNARYGKDTWQYLMSNAAKMTAHVPGDKSEYCRNYYNKILMCLNTDFSHCGDDGSKLIAFSEKLNRIQPTIPLEFNGYRNELNKIRNNLNRKFKGLNMEKYVVNIDSIKMPNFSGIEGEALIRWLRAYANAGSIVMYMGYSDTVPYGNVISVSDDKSRKVTKGTTLMPGKGYYVTVSPGGPLPSDWIQVPDIFYECGNTIYENKLEDSQLYKHLQGKGFKPVFEIIEPEAGYRFTYNTVYKQYPEVGTAVKYGSEIKIMVFLGKG